MKYSPVSFTPEEMERLSPYAAAIDPKNQSVAAFVRESVEAIIQMVHQKPGQSAVPSIVRRCRAAMNPEQIKYDSTHEQHHPTAGVLHSQLKLKSRKTKSA